MEPQHVGRSYRLYPSRQQADALTTSWAHTRRAIYNLGIEHRERAWALHRVSDVRVNYAYQCRELADLRTHLDWVAEPPPHVLVHPGFPRASVPWIPSSLVV